MGFSTLIDILGSTIVGGLLFMILLRMNDAAVENSFQNGGELIVQKNLVEVVKLLEHDFRKIGYCSDWSKIPNPTSAIISADSNSISFITDVDSDGYIDTMYYSLGPVSELLETPNPKDRFLYRSVNGETPVGANLGITEFELSFFNSFGDKINFPILVPSEIYTMQIDLTVENTSGYNNEFTSAFWRQIRLAARNLRNR